MVLCRRLRLGQQSFGPNYQVAQSTELFRAKRAAFTTHGQSIIQRHDHGRHARLVFPVVVIINNDFGLQVLTITACMT